MASILGSLADGYHYLFTEISDPRTQSWFLISSPLPGIGMLSLYLMFVLKWGPNWMKERKPFNLDRVLLVFNVLQIIACTYLFVEGLRQAWGWKYKWVCEPCDFSNTEEAIQVATLVYIYFLIKVVDLLDTVFFVLRKKNSQISFLHVYHHTGMVMITWGATKYLPGGHGTFVGLINSFVHVVMYAYYLLTIAYPVYKQSIWWKKYITQLQIVQFLWLVVHFLLVLVTPGCAYPRWTVGVFLPQNLFMLILFLDFYRKTYLKRPVSQSTKNGKPQNGVERNSGLATQPTEDLLREEAELELDSNSNVLKAKNGAKNGKLAKHD